MPLRQLGRNNISQTSDGSPQLGNALLLDVFFKSELLLAVEHAAKVCFLAGEALIEGASVHRESQQIALIRIAFCCQPLAFIQALALSGLQSLCFDALFQLGKTCELFVDLRAV